MRTNFSLRITFIFCFLFNISYAQKAPDFKYKMDCYKLLLEANTIIRTTNDTVEYSNLFNKIDSLTKLENNHDFYVKYRVLRGSLLARNGYRKEGLKYNIEALEHGKKYLPPFSPRTAVAHGNLGFTYNTMGEIDSFITHTLISTEILMHDPAKNAASLIQTNLNLEPYLSGNPDQLFIISEQNDSLIQYLSNTDYDIKAFYHLRKSKRAISNNNLRKSKFHISQVIQFFKLAVRPKPNLRKYYYNAIATHYFVLKDYRAAIANYKIYRELSKNDKPYNALAYCDNQIAICYKELNEVDSAKHYVYKAYSEIKQNNEEEKKYVKPYHAIQVLKLNYEISNTYDLEIYNELDSLSENLLIVPLYYLEYAKIRSEIIPEDIQFYKEALERNIKKTTNNSFKSYYVSKLAEHYFNITELEKADSLFNEALYLNQVMPEQTNSLVYNSNLLKRIIEFKYKILESNKSHYSNIEILERYDFIVQYLLAYVYENWDSVDKDDVLKEIYFYSNEAIEFCYSKGMNSNDVPYFDYALFFSDRSNSILFKYNHRRILALENSAFSEEKLSKLKFYKSQLDAYFYGNVGEIELVDLLDMQSKYNDLLIESQTSKAAFVETRTFIDFVNHLDEVEGQYDDIFVFHSTQKDVYKFDLKLKEVHKLSLSKDHILSQQKIVFDAMVNHNPSQYEQSAYTLYQSFFENGIEEGKENILIVNAPDLLPIPIEGLVKTKGHGKSGFNTLDYLLSDHVFTYNQGVSSDFDYKKNFDLSLPYVGVYSKGEKSLHYAKAEVEGVCKLLKGEIIHANTNKKNMMLERMKLAQVIHIATHSKIDTTNAYSSQLVFGNDTSNINLKYYQIMNMDINPNLLVLNACSTGDGQYKMGEGKISMARAFNYAGANNVLVNAWDVSDYSVKKVMESFFGYYTNKYDAGKSLQLAKKEYLENSDDLTGNPLYWAGTIFVSSANITNRNYLLNIVLGIFVLSGLIIGFTFIRNK